MALLLSVSAPPSQKTRPRKPEKTEEGGGAGKRKQNVGERQGGRKRGGWLEVLCERRIRLRRLEVEDDIIW